MPVLVYLYRLYVFTAACPYAKHAYCVTLLSLGAGDVSLQVVALRRLLSAGRLVRKFGAAGSNLVNEVGLGDQVLNITLVPDYQDRFIEY